MELSPTVVGKRAMELGLLTLKPQKLRRPAFLEKLRDLRAEALLVASYGRMIPPPLLELTPYPLNIHPSLLPELRGPSPIRTALLEGRSTTGCCIMKMSPRLDDGDIAAVEKIAIDSLWNFEELEEQLADVGARQAIDALDAAAQGLLKFTPQNEAQATYTRMHDKGDARIDWSQSARTLQSFLRAWDPDIGAWTMLPDGKRLKVWRAEVAESFDIGDRAAPGTVVGRVRDALMVQTGQGILRLLEVQPENRKRMSTASFLAGSRLEPGDRLEAASLHSR